VDRYAFSSEVSDNAKPVDVAAEDNSGRNSFDHIGDSSYRID